MNRFLLIALASALTCSTVYAENIDKQRAMKSKAVVKEFMGQLKGELKSAMKAGGPVNAINVCKDKAPAIAKNLSDKYGWKVARTSLKTRNPANAPDAWETSVLEKFDARQHSGEPVKPMAYFQQVESNNGSTFRFMKAIPTGKVCLTCHGQDIDDKVTAKLKESYPEDRATGYKLGQVRGAFTITQPLN